MPSIVQMFQWQPITLSLMAIQILIFIYQFVKKVPASSFCEQYERIVVYHEYWRVLTGSFSHLHPLHILFNMMSLWNLGFLEWPFVLGIVSYIRVSFLLLVCDAIADVSIRYILIRFFRWSDQATQWHAGYSGVLFGLMSLSAIVEPGAMSFFGLPIPSWLVPIVYLVILGLIPGISFVGHLAGIVIGFLIGLGAFRWFDNYLLICTAFWFFVAVIASAKTTTDLPLGCIHIIDPDEMEREERNVTIVNGVVVQNPSPGGAASAADESA